MRAGGDSAAAACVWLAHAPAAPELVVHARLFTLQVLADLSRRRAAHGEMQGGCVAGGVAWTVGPVSGDLKHECRGTEGSGAAQCRYGVVVSEKSPW